MTACGRYSVGFDTQHGVWRSYRLAPGGPWFTEIYRPHATESAAKGQCEIECR